MILLEALRDQWREPPEIQNLAVVGGKGGPEVQRDVPRVHCPAIEPELDAAVPGLPNVHELVAGEAAGGLERHGQDCILDVFVVEGGLEAQAAVEHLEVHPSLDFLTDLRLEVRIPEILGTHDARPARPHHGLSRPDG